MRRLQNTVGPDDAFRPVMACHGSACGAEVPCAGYVFREGNRNLALRVMAINGRVDFRAIDAACEGLDLWESFGEMLEAYEEANRGD